MPPPPERQALSLAKSSVRAFLPASCAAPRELEIGRRLLDRQPLSGAVDFPFPRVRRIGSQLCDQRIIFRIEVAAHGDLMPRTTEKRQCFWLARQCRSNVQCEFPRLHIGNRIASMHPARTVALGPSSLQIATPTGRPPGVRALAPSPSGERISHEILDEAYLPRSSPCFGAPSAAPPRWRS